MSNNQNSYFETEVLTAAPQKLRLMLIEGAMRYVAHTQEHWRQKQYEQGGETIDRARAIVNELIVGIDRNQMPEITGRLVDLYAYVFNTLIAAGFDHDITKLDDVLHILSIERETWQLLCQSLARQQPPPPHISSSRVPVDNVTADFSGGFSIEA